MRALCILFILFSWKVSAAANLCQARASAVQYLLSEQAQVDGEVYKKGEWPTQVAMGGMARALGLLKKGPLEDPNVFTTGSIHNVLAEIYLKYNSDPKIAQAIYAALNSTRPYRMNNGSYNFWPRHPAFSNEVHIPHFALTDPLVEGLTAIPGDADDTAVVELARYMAHAVCVRERGESPTCPVLNPHPETLFEPFTDKERLPAPSNFLHGEIGTGAYLTWLQREPMLPFLLHAIGPKENGPRIVLDKNDVDCVVNANVLRTLTLNGKTTARGYQEACHLLRSNAVDADFGRCGDYYPDTYWYHYAVARAYSDGAACLRPAVERSMVHLLESQQPDGRWHNDVLPGDDVLTTALALGALVKVGNQKSAQQQSVLRKGLEFLMAHKRTSPAGHTYWLGGVFFSAGEPVRTDVVWSSDSFTTSIVALVLYDTLAWLPQACTY